MKTIEELPNIGKTLANKLNKIGISNGQELNELGSENAPIQFTSSTAPVLSTDRYPI
ncbi:MAG: hypothetical protein GY790_03145 [Bacteroidetes bacterium]|nr:hypothetical protein [Bacteroidota bacterium]